MKHRHRFLIGALVVVALVAGLALLAPWGQGALAAGGVIYVDAGATGANSGTSWDDAFPTLQQALDVVGVGDQIWVAAGTYKPAAEYEDTGNRLKSFQMKNGVAIYGGFDPDAGEVAWGHRDWVGNPTILSGERGTAEDGLDDSYHVFYHPAGTVDGSAILDGFIITGGNARAQADASPHRSGGGMYNDRSSPTLNNVTFAGNSAADGGGMYNGTGSSPALSNCTFEGNEAGRGGGMHNLGSSPVMSNVTFAGNSADEGGGMYNSTGSLPTLTGCIFEGNGAGSGGGMYNLESSPALTDCTVEGNSAEHYGGGMNNYESSPTLNNVTFTGNSAVSCGGGICNEYSSSPTLTDCTFVGNESGLGGGMFNGSGSSPTLTNCTFTGNEAGRGGGMSNISSPTLTDCTFSDNRASDSGGGLYNDGSWTVLTNCTFEGNSAGRDGGGISNARWSGLTLTNCTFTGNSAGHGGGGMSNGYYSQSMLTNCTFTGNSAPLGGGILNDDLFSRLELTNCILWGDTSPEIYNRSWLIVTYSDIQGGYEGEGNIDLDPRFVDPDSGDFHLASDSPCIDAGSNDAPYGLPEYDFEGDPRILDGDGDGAAIVDMGVDEIAVE